MKKKLPQTSILDAMRCFIICLVRSIGINHKSGISEKSAEQAINEEGDPFKDIIDDLRA